MRSAILLALAFLSVVLASPLPNTAGQNTEDIDISDVAAPDNLL